MMLLEDYELKLASHQRALKDSSVWITRMFFHLSRAIRLRYTFRFDQSKISQELLDQVPHQVEESMPSSR